MIKKLLTQKNIFQCSEIKFLRIQMFNGKLYMEFGGKMFQDYHASRVLPGYDPNNKIKLLLELKEQVEIIICINANNIENSKARGDLGISYDQEVFRLIDAFKELGLYVGSVVITQYAHQNGVDAFRNALRNSGIQSYLHYPIKGYPTDVDFIVSSEGLGKNQYIPTTKDLVVVTAPGPGSGKWQPAFHSYIMMLRMASIVAMQSLKVSQSGIYHYTIQSILHMKQLLAI